MKKSLFLIASFLTASGIVSASLLFHKNKNETYKRDNPSDRKAVNWNNKNTATNADGMPSFTWTYDISGPAAVRVVFTGLDTSLASNAGCAANRAVIDGDFASFTETMTFPVNLQPGTNTIELQIRFANKRIKSNTVLFVYQAIYVSSSGSDANSGLLPSAPKRTIDAALEKCPELGVTKIYTTAEIYSRGSGVLVGYDGLLITNHNTHLSGGWNSNFTLQNGITTVDIKKQLGRGITVLNVSNIRIENIAIRQGLLVTDYGAGVLMENVSNSVFTNLSVSDCLLSSGRGAGFYMSNNIQNRLHVNVYNNKNSCATLNDSGGGIYMTDSYGVIISGAVFSNTALNYGGGGGMCFKRCSNSTTSAAIYGNMTPNVGGGILLVNCYSNHIGGQIFANDANTGAVNGMGGGVGLQSSASNLITADVFANITRNSGGGIYCDNNALSNTISAAVYCNSNSNGNGGGIYIYDGGGCVVTGSIYSNRTAMDGGGLCIQQGNIHAVNADIYGNRAQNGGGMRLSGSSIREISGSVHGNTALFSGAAVYSVAGMHVYSNIIISNNTCTNGAMFWHFDAEQLTFKHSSIVDNTATNIFLIDVNRSGGSTAYLSLGISNSRISSSFAGATVFSLTNRASMTPDTLTGLMLVNNGIRTNSVANLYYRFESGALQTVIPKTVLSSLNVNFDSITNSSGNTNW
ncbi:MAG: hypothetical protein HZC28_07990 [Spirochaetes bacterium]|nr:hypothetical protein [Spirochaetota bacterium]